MEAYERVLRQQSPRKKPLSPASPQILLLVEDSHVSIPFYLDNIIKTQAGPAIKVYALMLSSKCAGELTTSATLSELPFLIWSSEENRPCNQG